MKAALALAVGLVSASPAWAQDNVVAVDGFLVRPTVEGADFGYGIGARYGIEMELSNKGMMWMLTPELQGAYNYMGAGWTEITIMGGGRLVGVIAHSENKNKGKNKKRGRKKKKGRDRYETTWDLGPMAHAGISNFGTEGADIAPAVDIGLTLDRNTKSFGIGLHGAQTIVFDPDAGQFMWTAAGLHLTLPL